MISGSGVAMTSASSQTLNWRGIFFSNRKFIWNALVPSGPFLVSRTGAAG